jgi:hypothetical protein
MAINIVMSRVARRSPFQLLASLFVFTFDPVPLKPDATYGTHAFGRTEPRTINLEPGTEPEHELRIANGEA